MVSWFVEEGHRLVLHVGIEHNIVDSPVSWADIDRHVRQAIAQRAAFRRMERDGKGPPFEVAELDRTAAALRSLAMMTIPVAPADVAGGEARACKAVGLCRDCKHWGDEDDAGAYRPCLAIVHDHRSHTSTFLDRQVWRDETEPVSSDRIWASERFRERHKAVAWDHEGYRAETRTCEDFGCTLFEARPPIDDRPRGQATVPGGLIGSAVVRPSGTIFES